MTAHEGLYSTPSRSRTAPRAVTLFLRLDSTPTWNVRYELHAYVRCFLAGSTIGPAAGACGAGT